MPLLCEGDVGISVTCSPSALVKETRLSRRGSSLGASVMVGSSIEVGAPFRLMDSGSIFSSSAMVGSNARECGDVMSVPAEGDNIGDFAGLSSSQR